MTARFYSQALQALVLREIVRGHRPRLQQTRAGLLVANLAKLNDDVAEIARQRSKFQEREV